MRAVRHGRRRCGRGGPERSVTSPWIRSTSCKPTGTHRKICMSSSRPPKHFHFREYLVLSRGPTRKTASCSSLHRDGQFATIVCTLLSATHLTQAEHAASFTNRGSRRCFVHVQNRQRTSHRPFFVLPLPFWWTNIASSSLRFIIIRQRSLPHFLKPCDAANGIRT